VTHRFPRAPTTRPAPHRRDRRHHAGSIPLLLGSGAGAETRVVIGTVILSGVLAATLFTLFVVPVAYDLPARRTGSPGDVVRRLKREEAAVLVVSGGAAR
jgi:multidrug efflux pump